MSSKVRCFKCKGQKQYVGIGGIIRDCEACDKTGWTEKIELKIAPKPIEEPIEATESSEPKKVIMKKKVGRKKKVSTPKITKETKTETVSAEKAFKEMGAPSAVVNAVRNSTPSPIFPGYDDNLMKAVLAEPTMTTEEWKAAFPAIAETTDIRQRHSIRVMYAQSKPKKERTIALSDAQDAVAKQDPQYLADLEAENKKLRQLAAEKEGTTVTKKSGVGGM